VPATGPGVNSTSYLSAPLSNDPVYTGVVSAVTANTITVADSPAPWTANQFATAGSPFFVKFLVPNPAVAGANLEAGRTIFVTANTTNTLTLDTTDNSSQTVALTTTGFNVQVGDSFEVFPGNTLTSLFGDTTQNLVLNGGTSILQADTVSLYNAALLRFQSYYFNTTAGYWELSGSSANANNTIVYPYVGFELTRRANEAALSLVVTGRVAEVSRLIKTPGSGSVIYDSTGYPVDLTLSELQLGPNWVEGSSVLSADTLSVWDASLLRFDTYFETTSNTWLKSGGGATDQSSVVIPAGTTVVFLKRAAVSGATSYLQPALPYSPN